MTQVEDSISQFVELNHKEAIQLDNFLSLLIDLKIIYPPEQTSLILPIDSRKNEDFSKEKIELFQFEPLQDLVTESNLESSHSMDLDTTFELAENPILFESLPEQDLKTTETAEIDNQNLENPNQNHSDDEFVALQKLQELLVGSELVELHKFAAIIHKNLTILEHKIYDPQELISLLLPSINQLIRLKLIESKKEFVEAISPIVDEAIQSRIKQDKTSMASALAPAVPLAIAQQIHVDIEGVSEAIAPTMARAIKKQIELEKDTIVDALYPIIGSTIAKYMAETIRAINQQIEQTLSVEVIKRKIRAKLQGISEAELIFKESLKFTVQAIFLIHKASGLIISDIQRSDAQPLESEMVAGMLTAIRAFANDCIIQSGSVSELDAIDYGTSKIILEVAGHCYLAIVVQGEPPKAFIWKMRKTLGKLVNNYSESIENFDGDPATMPSQIYTLLEDLKDYETQTNRIKNQSSSSKILSLTVLSAILIPLGIWQYHNGIIRQVENKTALALASASELAVYRLAVEEDAGKLKLTGKVPNQLLRWKAEQIAKATAPKWLIDNQILSVEVPADPILAAAEVKRVTQVLNQIDGTAISTQYIAGKVSVEGTVSRIADAKTITQLFEQIPGVKSVSSAVQVQPLRIDVRFYFEPNSATLQPVDLEYKIEQVKFFLNQHSMKHLKIFGYSYSSSGGIEAQQLSLERAKAVQRALIDQGIDQSRLHIIETTNLPPGIDAVQPSWLRRCVVLELIAPR
jgi:outer membrane protein OmpA-like peptidoglycan-associated protein